MPDLLPPVITQVSPKRGVPLISPKAALVFRVADRGVAKLDLTTLQISVNDLEVVTDGAVVPDVGWDASEVLPWEEGAAPAVTEVLLKADALHAYDSTLVCAVSATDNDGNSVSRTFTLTVAPSPEYDGSDDNAVLSPFELAVLAPFDDPATEAFRKRVLHGLVPGAVPDTDEIKQAARRALQLLFRYRQDPILSRMFTDEKPYNATTMPDARTYEELLELRWQFAEAVRQVLYVVSRSIDEAYLGYVQGLASSNAVAAALVLLTVLCVTRDQNG